MNPQEIKKRLALEIVTRFHGEEAAARAPKSAGNLLAPGEMPEDIPEVELQGGPLPIAAVLNQAGLVKNAAGARDVLQRGVVYVDGVAVTAEWQQKPGETHVIQAGKKAIARVLLKK